MTIEELADGLETLGYPVAYSHFEEAVELPFICYRDAGEVTFSADNKPIHEINDITIELYSWKKDLAAERKIKDFLKEHDLSWTATGALYMQDEKAFMSAFSITLI